MGIFGFLSKAHLDQVQPTSGNQLSIDSYNKQINQQQIIIDRAEKTLNQLDKALDVYIDKEYVTRGLKERNKQKEERDLLNKTIDEATSKILELNKTKNTIELEQLKIEAEVGPLKYVAELIYGDEAKNHFDSAVRIVILILIFVFDPLAVLLLIAANISLRQWKMKKTLIKENQNVDLKKKIEQLEKRNKKLKGFKDITKGLGDNPDEIKVKLNEIMSINDRQDRNV
jgi:hypothetical protein